MEAESARDCGDRIRARGDLALRVVAAAAALVAAAIHLALAAADLIPGEPTRGPLFALMGLGYLASAPAILARRPVADGLVLLYAVGLLLAYATSRGELPVEPIGLATKSAEMVLAVIVAFILLRRRREAH
ncbi:MAG: hypothetical protein M3T56_06840 [Chloroflexota bacterium]|nr:hypothetical protein [Chloroflexota bacterium]